MDGSSLAENCRGLDGHSQRKSTLQISSFNCRGFSSSVDDVRKLFSKSDMLAVQELWLNPTNFWRLSQISDDVMVVTAVSPMKKDVIYCGRPFGGVALMWHKSLQNCVFPINTASDRIAAAVLHINGRKVLLVTVYMPVDYGDDQSYDDFVEELGNLGGILSSVVFDSCVCIGDFS